MTSRGRFTPTTKFVRLHHLGTRYSTNSDAAAWVSCIVPDTSHSTGWSPCKVILAADHATPAHRQRFAAEARAVARLRHPNVVQVSEVGEHAGLPYFTLEYIPGGSLERYAVEPLPPRRAAELAELIARGVAHAHAAGIVHHDLKPANVLLDADGTPKVCDFGLAKFADG